MLDGLEWMDWIPFRLLRQHAPTVLKISKNDTILTTIWTILITLMALMNKSKTISGIDWQIPKTLLGPSDASAFKKIFFTRVACNYLRHHFFLKKNDVGDHVTRFVQYERSRSPGAKECLRFRFMFCCCFYWSLRGLFTMAGGQQYRISVWPVWLYLCCVFVFLFILIGPNSNLLS